MRRTTLTMLAGLLASCAPHATPDPESAPPRLIGYLQVNTDPGHPDARWVNPVTLTPLTLTETPGVQFRSVTTAPAAVNDTARGERFFSTTLQVSAPERRTSTSSVSTPPRPSATRPSPASAVTPAFCWARVPPAV